MNCAFPKFKIDFILHLEADEAVGLDFTVRSRNAKEEKEFQEKASEYYSEKSYADYVSLERNNKMRDVTPNDHGRKELL